MADKGEEGGGGGPVFMCSYTGHLTNAAQDSEALFMSRWVIEEIKESGGYSTHSILSTRVEEGEMADREDDRRGRGPVFVCS